MYQVYLRVRLLFNLARPAAHHPVNLTENARTADVVVSRTGLRPRKLQTCVKTDRTLAVMSIRSSQYSLRDSDSFRN
jgi:hypothetical protein